MSDYAELKARLSIKADMIQLGEKIEWGSDSALMREAAAAIDALERERDKDGEEILYLRSELDAAETLAKRLIEESQRWKRAFAAQSNKLQKVLYIPSARAALQEDKSHGQ